MTDKEALQVLILMDRFQFLRTKSRAKTRDKLARKVLCDLRALLNEMELLEDKHYGDSKEG